MRLSFVKKTLLICAILFAASISLFADTTYKVEKGDTLYSISRKYQITVAELRAANNLSENDVIKVGQKLKIPTADISNAAALATENKATTSGSATLSATKATKEYTVVKGDTMYSISKKNGMTLAEFMALNGLDSNSVIKVGQKLKIYSLSKGKKQPVLRQAQEPQALPPQTHVPTAQQLPQTKIQYGQ